MWILPRINLTIQGMRRTFHKVLQETGCVENNIRRGRPDIAAHEQMMAG
jgi:hypothetical protein